MTTPTPPQAGGRKPQDELRTVVEMFAGFHGGRMSHFEFAKRFGMQPDRIETLEAILARADVALSASSGDAGGGTGGGGQPPTHSLTPEERAWLDAAQRFAVVDCDDPESAVLREALKLIRRLDAIAADPARRQQTPPACTCPPRVEGEPIPVDVACPVHGIRWRATAESVAKPISDEEASQLWWAGNYERLGGHSREDLAQVAFVAGRESMQPSSAPSSDAPPRPPQGRQEPKPCRWCGRPEGEHGEPLPMFRDLKRRSGRPCPVSHGGTTQYYAPQRSRDDAEAPTPAPTLTAEEEAALNRAIKQLNNLSCGTVLVLIRLRDRLLAAGAPTAASTALTAEERPARRWSDLSPVERSQVQRAHSLPTGRYDVWLWRSLGAEAWKLVDPAAGADAAPAAEGASE